jgi:hypothetical protein
MQFEHVAVFRQRNLPFTFCSGCDAIKLIQIRQISPFVLTYSPTSWAGMMPKPTSAVYSKLLRTGTGVGL